MLAVLPYQFAIVGWPPVAAVPTVVGLAIVQNAVPLVRMLALNGAAGVAFGWR